MLLESDSSWLTLAGPYPMLPRLSAPVSGVDCPCPFFHANPLLFASLLSSRPLPSAGSRRQLSFASPSHFQIRRDFMSKNPLSGFAPKQAKESSALAAYPHSATYPPLSPLSFILNKLQHNSTTSKKTKTFTVSNNRTYKILKGFSRPLKKKINNITTPYHHTHKKKLKKKKNIAGFSSSTLLSCEQFWGLLTHPYSSFQ